MRDSHGRRLIVEPDDEGDYLLEKSTCRVFKLGPGDVPRKAYHRVKVVERK